MPKVSHHQLRRFQIPLVKLFEEEVALGAERFRDLRRGPAVGAGDPSEGGDEQECGETKGGWGANLVTSQASNPSMNTGAHLPLPCTSV